MLDNFCEICGVNKSSGSVGNIIDPSIIEWVCTYCYRHKLLMRDLLYEPEMTNITSDIIEACKNYKPNQNFTLNDVVKGYMETFMNIKNNWRVHSAHL